MCDTQAQSHQSIKVGMMVHSCDRSTTKVRKMRVESQPWLYRKFKTNMYNIRNTIKTTIAKFYSHGDGQAASLFHHDSWGECHTFLLGFLKYWHLLLFYIILCSHLHLWEKETNFWMITNILRCCDNEKVMTRAWVCKYQHTAFPLKCRHWLEFSPQR